MSTSQEPILQADTQESAPKVAEPTAKALALAEEENMARRVAHAKAEEQKLQPTEEPLSILNLAAQGHDVLHAAILKHRDQPKKHEYTPPPRTERQMTALQEELEAGRRTQQRAEEQQAHRPVEKTDGRKEGFTDPVYRPNNMVPDPMTGKLGSQRDPE